MDFQKRVSYRLQFLHRKLPIFSEITDFNEIKETTDFSRHSLPTVIFPIKGHTVQCIFMKNDQN